MYYILWWQIFFNNGFYISSHGTTINFLICAFSLSSDYFTYQPNFSLFWPWIFCHPLANTVWLTNLLPSFWLFLLLFWILWMLVTVFKPCHVPHVSQITTTGTLFTEKLFSVSKESARSWSHAFFIIYNKTFAKKLKAVRAKSCGEREKGKEKERQLQSVMR